MLGRVNIGIQKDSRQGQPAIGMLVICDKGSTYLRFAFVNTEGLDRFGNQRKGYQVLRMLDDPVWQQRGSTCEEIAQG